MALLSSSRLEAVRLIREQLQCTLCGNIFQEPQCLDCKHNFCLPCILQHLRVNNSYCPTCQLPTRPSEVTRNQFLESILLAWNGVEVELKALNGDPNLHATRISVTDTEKVLHRVANGVVSSKEEEHFRSRGPVANNKWHIDTQGIRQELHLEQSYLPQYGGMRYENTAGRKKTSSSDLSEDYSASARETDRKAGRKRRIRERENDARVVTEKISESDDDSRDEMKEEVETRGSNNLMTTQDVETYLARITKQREALSQWEREHHDQANNTSLLLDLERSLQSSNDFDELLRERRVSQQHVDDGDLLTQMTQATSALESPDLLATLRQHRRWNKNDRLVAKRQIIFASPARKRLRMPVLQDARYQAHDSRTKAVNDLHKTALEEVRTGQPRPMFSKEENEASENGVDDGDEDYEEEFEMKPAKPILASPKKHMSRDQGSKRHNEIEMRKNARVNENFGRVFSKFQAKKHSQDETTMSQTAQYSASMTSHPKVMNDTTIALPNDILRPNHGEPLRSSNHTSNNDKKALENSENVTNFVFVSSDLTRDEVKRVLEATQRLGGKFGHDFDLKRDPVTNRFCTSVTHLITKAVPPIKTTSEKRICELRCKRTAKYMRALAEGTFVMDFSWISASLAANRWLTEDPFEMIGDIYSDAVGKPHEGHIRRVQTGRRNSIFSLFCFVLLVSEKEFDFQFASVKMLVNNFGGTVVHAENARTFSWVQHSRRTPVGIVAKTTTPLDAKTKWQQVQIPIVRITWIFDSVSHLEVLPFDDYYPY